MAEPKKSGYHWLTVVHSRARLSWIACRGNCCTVSFAESPIISSPFSPPEWHFELDGDGQPTGKKLAGRRESVYVVPVPAARQRGL